MSQPAVNPYLRTKVLTASPEELRLMLYDGAIKFCRQSIDAVGKKDWETMYHRLIRAQQIVLELNTSLNHDVDPVLCDRLSSLYNYWYRRLVDANLERDDAPIHEVIGLIEFERETWLMVMKKLKDERAPGSDKPGVPASAGMSPPESPNPIGKIGPTPAPGTAPGSSPRISIQG